MASKTFYECGCMEQGDQYFACDQHKADPIVRPMPADPRETATAQDRKAARKLLTTLYAFDIEPDDTGFDDDIALVCAELDKARQEGRVEQAAECVPTTWLDPLLSGKGAIALPADGPTVERLLNAIRHRILALALTEVQPKKGAGR